MNTLTVLTTGQFPLITCGRCNSTFTGPQADRYYLAHRESHLRTVWVK
mgnify:CR=1 FL=1